MHACLSKDHMKKTNILILQYRSWCDDVDKGKASAEVREKILTAEDDDIKKEPEEPEVNDTGQVE